MDGWNTHKQFGILTLLVETPNKQYGGMALLVDTLINNMEF